MLIQVQVNAWGFINVLDHKQGFFEMSFTSRKAPIDTCRDVGCGYIWGTPVWEKVKQSEFSRRYEHRMGYHQSVTIQISHMAILPQHLISAIRIQPGKQRHWLDHSEGASGESDSPRIAFCTDSQVFRAIEVGSAGSWRANDRTECKARLAEITFILRAFWTQINVSPHRTHQKGDHQVRSRILHGLIATLGWKRG